MHRPHTITFMEYKLNHWSRFITNISILISNDFLLDIVYDSPKSRQVRKTEVFYIIGLIRLVIGLIRFFGRKVTQTRINKHK